MSDFEKPQPFNNRKHYIFYLKHWLLRNICNKQNVGGSDYPRRPEAEVSEKALFTTVDNSQRRRKLETMRAAAEQVSRAQHQLQLVDI